MKKSRATIFTLLLTSGTIFASCGVDTKGLLFDDDAFEDAKNPTGDGDSDGGNGGTTGVGDGDGDGDVSTTTGEGGDGGETATPQVEPECTMTGELKCSGKQVQVCTGEFFIDAGEPCAFVCHEGACVGSCFPGSTECVSETEQRGCNTLGTWGEASQCKNVCSGEACGGVCKPGDRSCDETNLALKLVCNSEGQWDEDGECTVGACAGGSCTSCVGSETQCTPDSKSVETCTGDSWGAPVECIDQVCVAGACTGECRPALGDDVPQRKCVPGSPSTQLETCGGDGQFGGAIDCNYVCVEGDQPGKNDQCGGVCQPGNRRCEDGILFECSSDGLSEDKLEDCGSQNLSCLDVGEGILGCGECTPGTEKDPNTRCAQLVVQECVGGFWKESQDCGRLLTLIGETSVCYQGACTTGNAACDVSRGDAYGCSDIDTKWVCADTTTGIAKKSCLLKSSCTLSSCITSFQL
jgi:hypothetical protein